MRPLRILHVLRAPVGGLFRYVADLAREQSNRGHQVGIVADSLSGGTEAEAKFAALAPVLNLGLSRVPMSRHLGPRDLWAIRHVSVRARESRAEVLHGHGAKGGAYARLARSNAIRVYTPHGGSLHYSRHSLLGLFYIGAERWLRRRTDVFLFESVYSSSVFRHKVGSPGALVRVVHNGVLEADFAPINIAANASDVVFIGELRTAKGVFVLIDAIGILARADRKVTATIVGEGPDGEPLRARARAQGVADAVHFVGAMPARQGFCLGRLLTVPSIHESLPYIVLEAAATGVPMLTTRVGGIPEIFGPEADRLVAAGDASVLAKAIIAALDHPQELYSAAKILRERVRAEFSAEVMVDGVLAAYADGINAQRPVNG